jgi:hypothetical protein
MSPSQTTLTVPAVPVLSTQHSALSQWTNNGMVKLWERTLCVNGFKNSLSAFACNADDNSAATTRMAASRGGSIIVSTIEFSPQIIGGIVLSEFL